MLPYEIILQRSHGPLARCVNLRVVHAMAMPGTFSPPPPSKETARSRSRDASRYMRHARVVMHVGIANPQWRGNVPGIPGACATRNFTYLARGQWTQHRYRKHTLNITEMSVLLLFSIKHLYISIHIYRISLCKLHTASPPRVTTTYIVSGLMRWVHWNALLYKSHSEPNQISWLNFVNFHKYIYILYNPWDLIKIVGGYERTGSHNHLIIELLQLWLIQWLGYICNDPSGQICLKNSGGYCGES